VRESLVECDAVVRVAHRPREPGVTEAAALGVRRISVGGTLARTAWAGFLLAAREIADAGTFSAFEQLPNVDAQFV
jgi:2-methylisocitrate lyase-like PEP mutase family enzyme